MRIVINGRFLTQKTSGVQRFAQEITKCLFRHFPDVEILCPPGADLAKLPTATIRTIGKRSGHAWEQIELPRYLRAQGNPLLVNFCNTGPLFYANQVVTVHDVCFAKHPEWYSRSFRLFYNFLVPRILRKARAVLTVSQFSKTEIIGLYRIPQQKIHVVPNAVSGAFSATGSQESAKEPIILSVASVDPRKNQQALIEAFATLDLPDWKLYLVGAKHQAFSRQEVESTSPNVYWTGYLEDSELIDAYQKASLFVYPSLYEGFGIPPLEAMSVGCPVLVSDIPALRETCGDSALYFDPKKSSDIAKKIKDLIDNKQLKARLSIEGRERSMKFSWEHSAEQVQNVINSLV